jgi:hypothetical protein
MTDPIRLPVIQELTVPSSDEPRLSMRFVCKEYVGEKLCYVEVGGVLSDLEDLEVGEDVKARGLLGDWVFLSVTSVNGTKGVAENEATRAFLEFGADDRNCWTVKGFASKKVTRFEISR